MSGVVADRCDGAADLTMVARERKTRHKLRRINQLTQSQI